MPAAMGSLAERRGGTEFPLSGAWTGMRTGRRAGAGAENGEE